MAGSWQGLGYLGVRLRRQTPHRLIQAAQMQAVAMQVSQPQLALDSSQTLVRLGLQCLRSIPRMLIQAVASAPQQVSDQQEVDNFLSQNPAPEVQGCQELEYLWSFLWFLYFLCFPGSCPS
jgi:hypothetical protein